MAITFPASPTTSQIFTSGNKSWIWDGVTWLAYGASLSPTVLKVDTANARVGINNQSPAYALDVNGTIEATQFLQGTDYLSPYQGFRNKIINGDFKVWQRGTTKAMATGAGNGFIADRWTAARAGYAVGGTVSRQTASLDGFQYCSRVQRDSGNTSTAVNYYFQTFESATSIPLANKPVVYSFYIRAGANFSGSVVAALYSGTATDQQNYPDAGITGSVTVITSTLSLTTSWQRVVLYGNVASTATQLFVGFEHTPSGTAGTSDYFEVTGVQLEEGGVATPFEHRPIGTELSLCQRYYQRMVDPAGIGVNDASVQATRMTFPLKVQMRASPTSTISGTMNFWNGAITGTGTAFIGIFNTRDNGQLDFNGGVGATSSVVTLYTTGGSQYIDFSAEL